MARALSGEKGLPLFAIDGPQLFSKWLGESEKALREVFKKARRAAPCILFFDTIDAIAPKLGDRAQDQVGGEVYQRILSQLLREIDNLRDVKGVILVAATNRLERVDPALLRSGRFDYVLRFTVPSVHERETVFRLCCNHVPLASDVDVRELADRTDGLTGADIESLCKKATLLAIDQLQTDASRSRDAFLVSRREFLSALESQQHPN
jgi:transitional endoplasmic reticulum ATPase